MRDLQKQKLANTDSLKGGKVGSTVGVKWKASNHYSTNLWRRKRKHRL